MHFARGQDEIDPAQSMHGAESLVDAGKLEDWVHPLFISRSRDLIPGLWPLGSWSLAPGTSSLVPRPSSQARRMVVEVPLEVELLGQM